MIMPNACPNDGWSSRSHRSGRYSRGSVKPLLWSWPGRDRVTHLGDEPNEHGSERAGHIEGTCGHDALGNDEKDREPDAEVRLRPGTEPLVGGTCWAVRPLPLKRCRTVPY
jgi:hypothetical protein